jgi:Ca-activated chloride channel family protein
VKTLLVMMFLLMLSGVGLGQTTLPHSSPDQSSDTDRQAITTLKVTTRVVEIAAVVKSKDGEIKGGLTKDDFVLKQDGKEEPIHYFSQGSELPLTLALMVDTSGSQRTFIGDESLASDVFFETMLGDKRDRAMLVQFDNSVVQLRSLTPSASALHLALLRMSSHAAMSGGTLLNDAIYSVAKASLAIETGRKAMVILSDGGDNGSRRSVAEAIEQAQRADVQIYCILYSEAHSSGGMATGRPVIQDTGLEILEKLSESTGGQVFKVSPAFGLRQIYAQIGRSLRLQYELGYTPPPELQPNVYHKLELRAKDRKLTVQARKGFFGQP